MSKLLLFLGISWYFAWMVADYEAVGTGPATWRFPVAFVGAVLLMAGAAYWDRPNGSR